MKTLITSIATAVVTVSLMAGATHAGLLDSFLTSDWKERKVNARYTMEVYGFDVRVYEFTTLNNMNCVVVFGNKQGGGVGCTKK